MRISSHQFLTPTYTQSVLAGYQRIAAMLAAAMPSPMTLRRIMKPEVRRPRDAQRLLVRIAASSAVDAGRVEAMRAALAAGRFHVRPDQTAANLMRMERDLTADR
jgi:hypothetical protein